MITRQSRVNYYWRTMLTGEWNLRMPFFNATKTTQHLSERSNSQMSVSSLWATSSITRMFTNGISDLAILEKPELWEHRIALHSWLYCLLWCLPGYYAWIAILWSVERKSHPEHYVWRWKTLDLTAGWRPMPFCCRCPGYFEWETSREVDQNTWTNVVGSLRGRISRNSAKCDTSIKFCEMIL